MGTIKNKYKPKKDNVVKLTKYLEKINKSLYKYVK